MADLDIVFTVTVTRNGLPAGVWVGTRDVLASLSAGMVQDGDVLDVEYVRKGKVLHARPITVDKGRSLVQALMGETPKPEGE